MKRVVTIVCALVTCLVVQPVLIAQQPAAKTVLELMPKSVVAYAEIPRPQQALDTMLDHRLTQAVLQYPDVQAALRTPDMEQFQKVLALVEGKLGTKWRPGVSTLTQKGIYLGVDIATQGVVVLVESSDAKLLEKSRDTFIELARQDAKDKGQGDPIKLDEHRGATVYRLGDVVYATQGTWLIASNKPLLVRMVLDNAAGMGAGGLGEQEQFQAARKTKQGAPTVWGYLDLTVLRLAGVFAKLSAKSDNPLLEILGGGIAAALPSAPFVTATIDLSEQQLQVSAALPYDPAKIAKPREFYLGAGGKGSAPPLLAPRDTLLSLSTYRDFEHMWKHAPDLFDDNINAKFAEAESNLSTFFSGRRFGDEVLPSVEPGLQVVLVRQQFSEGDVVPQIKLPALAVAIRVKNPAETSRQFKITYQSLVGFLNIAGAQAKLEPLEQNVEKIGEVTVASAAYLPPAKEKQQAGGIHFNASPTVAFVGNRFIIASTRKLAIEVAEILTKNAPSAEAGVNTQLKVDGKVLQTLLAENREQLIAQNMTEKGHDRGAAEKEIGGLLELLKAFGGTTLRLTTNDSQLRLSWNVQLAE